MSLRAIVGISLIGASAYLFTRRSASASVSASYIPTIEPQPIITPYVRAKTDDIFTQPIEVEVMPIQKSGFKLSQRSLDNLRGVKPEMVSMH